MSAQEIIAELQKLKPDEFRLVREKVEDLAKARRQTIGEPLPSVTETPAGPPRDPGRSQDHVLHAERIAGRLILAGSHVIHQAEVEAILDEFP